MEEALDLNYCSDSDAMISSTDKTLKTVGARATVSQVGSGDKAEAGRQLRSVVVKPAGHRVTYKDALTGVRTFKPRFNAATATGKDGWSVQRRKQSDARPMVWDRLGARAAIGIHDHARERVSAKERLGPQNTKDSSLLQLLRVKAEHRCFKCLVRDHRIAQCRDPPRCILCSKSGHKARLCKTYSGVPARAVPRAGAEATSARWQEKKKAGGMEFIPGEPEQRPAKIKACAARTEAVREAERELSLHSLVGVLLDARVRITCEQVRRDVLRQLRIPDHLLAVSKLRDATFLLQFERPELRNAALGRGMLSTGLTKLHFLPWTRQYAATSASKLHYRHPLMLSSLTLREKLRMRRRAFVYGCGLPTLTVSPLGGAKPGGTDGVH